MSAIDAWLGIDLGTQSVRALAVTDEGVVLAAVSAPLTSHRDGHRHEQDPEQWWTATITAVTAITRALSSGTAIIRGLSVDGTSGTILLTDAAITPLTAGLMYDDGRAAEHVDRVNEAGHNLWNRLGYRTMQPSWALPKLAWLTKHHPDLIGAAGTR